MFSVFKLFMFLFLGNRAAIRICFITQFRSYRQQMCENIADLFYRYCGTVRSARCARPARTAWTAWIANRSFRYVLKVKGIWLEWKLRKKWLINQTWWNKMECFVHLIDDTSNMWRQLLVVYLIIIQIF